MHPGAGIRKLALGGLAICSLMVACVAVPSVAQTSQKPNILFIMGDDIGWMQPSIYYHRGLVLLCYKKAVPQKGQLESCRREPGQSFVAAWQSSRGYAARREPGEPRGRNWAGGSGTDNPSWPARAEGKNGSVGHQEPIGRNTEGSVMVKTAPASSFIMTQSEFLLQLFVIAFDDPAMLGQSHQVPQRRVCRESGEPVLGRFRFLAGPLDQQPFLGVRFTALEIAVSRTNAQRREARAELAAGTFSPRHFLPCPAAAPKPGLSPGPEHAADPAQIFRRPSCPFQAGLGSGPWPGFHTVTEDMIPTT